MQIVYWLIPPIETEALCFKKKQYIYIYINIYSCHSGSYSKSIFFDSLKSV